VETTTAARSPRRAGQVGSAVRGADHDGGEPPTTPHVDRPRWLTTYVAVLVVVDAVAMIGATALARMSWLGLAPADLHLRSVQLPYLVLSVATVPTWLVILALVGAYDLGPFGAAAGLWTRVVRAGAQLLAVVAVAYYVLHLEMIGRGVLVAVIPLAVALTLAVRAAVGLAVRRARRQGLARRSALVVGSRRGVEAVVHQLTARPSSGITPVGALVVGPTAPADGGNGNGNGGASADDDRSHEPAGGDEPRVVTGDPAPGDPAASRSGAEALAGPGGPPVVTGDPAPAVAAALARSGAEAVIVTGGLARGQLRAIAWRLEGTGVELLVMPAPGDLEGLRAEIRPVAGLPLLYVDQ
jgi:CoA-binding domain